MTFCDHWLKMFVLGSLQVSSGDTRAGLSFSQEQCSGSEHGSKIKPYGVKGHLLPLTGYLTFLQASVSLTAKLEDDDHFI